MNTAPTTSLLIAVALVGLSATAPIAQNASPSVAEKMAEVVDGQGGDAAVDLYRKLARNHPDEYNFDLAPIVQTAVDAFKAGQRQKGIGLLEACKRLFPEKVQVYSVLAQFYWYAEDRERCIENFEQTLRLDPDNVTAKRYRDLLFFVPEEFKIPQLLLTDHLRVRPLRVSDVDLDYRAVMSSIDHLRGVFGPGDEWPSEDLTREDDLHALQNHEREHERRTAFTYTVMNHEETECLGCVYILPTHPEEYDAQVFLWVTADAFRAGYDDELYAAVKNWIEKDWPFQRVAYPGRAIDWEAWEKIDE